MPSQVEKVQSIYAAFGRGDVPAILEHLAEDIAWEYQPVGNDVPWLQPRRGRAEVPGFFQAVGAELEITSFAVKQLAEGPGLVVALIDISATVRRNGRTLREVDEVHLWHFDAAGRIARFRHCVDTDQHVRAWHAR